ncbi:glycosyltransferase [Microcella sp.]|uniref:glycosyltransferase n=1 Tax=Microcella sp. TaxID=1913979 RepID=UPI003F70D42D
MRSAPDRPVKLSLVIPAYNEQEGLPRLFEALGRVSEDLSVLSVRLEVVVVDNDSDDDTWPLLNNWASGVADYEVVLIQHPVNLGMQQSLLTGIRLSTGEAVAVMQSDLQDPPELIPKMVEGWLSGASFVATRIERRNEAVVPRAGAWAFYRVLGFVADSKVLPDSSDFYLFDAKYRTAVVSNSGSTPFIRATLAGITPPNVVIPYERRGREDGTTNFNLARRVNFALDAFLRDLSGLVKKTVAMALLTGGISLLGLAVLATVFVFGYRSPVAGWISTMGILLLLLSTSMFIGAVTLELLSRIYRDISRVDRSSDSKVVRFT